ncbi:hypothetical protein [Streptomyces tsukubensis]|uniref:Guanylate cyclase domain-containing protein n=1 Tax=Streptomyces tsukubensis TaxID=83656 RepID=A0A1V4A3R1_9ACTN|nr:hypothetical protein [Streptomyces tsukubensis]OON74941.1 hypothetical protein B1H18_24315 [Streptomyces tsukubensis]QFR94742.1 hypothetical protein GBW32_18985 [Streptomyces tsukubensis]
MSTPVPVPYSESRSLPPYRALFAVDAKDFTGLPAVQHGPVSQLIPELVDQALEHAGLHELRDSKRFPANTGDGVVFGFDPALLPFVLWPFLGVLDDILGAYNRQSVGPRIRLRASVHLGPLPDADNPGDGNGTARNDTHRLLDSRPVKAIMAAASEEVTHLAAVISERVYEDVVLSAYTGLHPDRCVEVPATVEGKNFSQRAWLYVPSPSGNLVQAGVRPRDEAAARGSESTEREQDPVARPGTRYSGNKQHVGEGAAVMGNVGRDVTYRGGSTSYRGTNQHWGSGDNVKGDKQVGGAGGDR